VRLASTQNASEVGKFGERTFSVADPRACNNLPMHVCTAENTDTFKQKLTLLLCFLTV